MKNVLMKLSKIQTELKAPKGQFNSFGKYKYRSCEDILEGVKPLLAEHKCAITIADEMVMIGERYYIKATATLHDCESGESIFNAALAREEEIKKGMDSSQVTGATSSYARKYALNGLLAIDDTKDSDATNNHGKGNDDKEIEKLKNEKIQAVHISHIKNRLAETDSDFDGFLAFMDIEKLEDMTLEQFTNKAKPALDKKKKATK